MKLRPNLPCVFAMVVTCSLSWDSGACTADDDSTLSKKPDVNLRTAYLAETVGRAHQITIAGQLGGKGKVTLDGNTCTTNLFGDPQICTKILFHAIDVEINQLRLADSSGQGRRIFLLDGDLAPEGAKYYLIVPRRRSEAHRLVVDLGQDRRRVITLEVPVKQEGE